MVSQPHGSTTVAAAAATTADALSGAVLLLLLLMLLLRLLATAVHPGPDGKNRCLITESVFFILQRMGKKKLKVPDFHYQYMSHVDVTWYSDFFFLAR